MHAPPWLRWVLFPLIGCGLPACSDGIETSDAARDVVRDLGNGDVSVDGGEDVVAADTPTSEAGCARDEQCDDGDPCTTNLCDTTNGACGYRRIDGCCRTAAQCDDGNTCTTDRCDIAMNRCTRTAVPGCCNGDGDCNDSDLCTRDACDVAMNRCSFVPVAGCCVDGATRSCYSGAVGTSGRGICRSGMQTCVGGTYDASACVGEVVPAASEVCDGAAQDENCNGMANEGCTCTGTATQSCYTGPTGTSGVGTCRPGTQACAGGMWGTCTGQVIPATDVCGNGMDEDCNGSDRACPPANDNRAGAITLVVGLTETVATGTTVGATHDGPTVSCACSSAANVWYRFTTPTDAAVYLDTSNATAGLDTSLFVTDSAGVPVIAQPQNGQPNAGLCNDDAGCGGVAGWGGTFQSRTWGFLRAGTYFVAVGGCGTGTFTIHLQHIPITEGSYFYSTRITGDTSTSTFLIGTNMHSGTCGGRISGEDVYWFVTCGAPQFFSLCEGDGGGYLSRNSTSDATRWDPVLYTHSGITGRESSCSDTGTAGIDCRGRIGASLSSTTFDTVQGGARLNNVPVTRGVNAILVDERARGSGMDYRLRFRLRDR